MIKVGWNGWINKSWMKWMDLLKDISRNNN